MSETSVTTIIRGLKQGDHEAAEQLWVKYFDKLVGRARRMMASVPKRTYDEEDVAVSVLDTLCRGAERGNFEELSDREDLWALLLALTRQKAVDRIRRETRQKRGGGKVRGDSVIANLGSDPTRWGIDQLVADDATPEMLVEMDEQLSHLLSLLPDDTIRRIVTLRMEGWTVTEIADEFGYTTRWAERKLQLIRSKWQRELNRD